MKMISRDKNKDLVQRLNKIHNCDLKERELLIEDYIPFIIKTAAKFVDGYLDLKNSDEYSVALIAFNEAVDKYKEEKGSFIGFARLVINNRLKDYLKKANRHDEVVLKEEIVDTEDFTERLDLRNQIELFAVKLKTFDITLDDLVQSSPKHYDTRVRSVKMAKYIIDIEELKYNFYRLKRLPVLILSQIFEVATKTIKRTRKFTIATTLVLDSELNLIKSRILQIEGGDEHV